jgi:hypothetical protein
MVSLERHVRCRGRKGGLDERICWHEADALGYGTSTSFTGLRLFLHTELVSGGVSPAKFDEQFAGGRESDLSRVIIYMFSIMCRVVCWRLWDVVYRRRGVWWSEKRIIKAV